MRNSPSQQNHFFPCSTPAYDYAPNPDKQWVLQVTDRMEPIQKKFTDFLMTKRLQTLQSIDDAVERVSLFFNPLNYFLVSFLIMTPIIFIRDLFLNLILYFYISIAIMPFKPKPSHNITCPKTEVNV